MTVDEVLFTARCRDCQTVYEIPRGKMARTKAFRNAPPAAHLVVWACYPGQRIPDWENDPVIHECRHGDVVVEHPNHVALRTPPFRDRSRDVGR